MTADEALAINAHRARLNLKDFFWAPGELDSDGNETQPGQRKPLSELSDDQARCIAGFKHTQHGVDILFHDSNHNLTQAMKHLKLLNDKLEVSGADGGPIELRWAGDTNAET